MQNKRFIARLDKVGGDLVPSQRSRAGYDKGLRGGIGGLEELSQVDEDFAEGIDEGLADMRFTTSKTSAFNNATMLTR